MTNTDIYKDIAARTNGSLMLGVVGPVRTGKSTFIKRFMELMVIPNIDDVYARERAKDELPQSGSGRVIMTSEPKFVPEDAVEISLGNDTHFSVRLIDCVGYMVNGAAGQYEDGTERMVTTPWFDHEITMTEAAESGTHRVITEHSTIGLVITTDGSICDIPREAYLEPEERVINELKEIGKPFSLILNCDDPHSESAMTLRDELSEKYGVTCICVNCREMSESDLENILSNVLGEFPISELALRLPEWFDALDSDNELKKELFSLICTASGELDRVRDIEAFLSKLKASDIISSVSTQDNDMGSGRMSISADMPRELYYETISAETGLTINNDSELFKLLREISKIKSDYEHIKPALDAVRETGYGVVMPSEEELELGEPQIVKQGGKYAVKLRTSANAIHMLKTAVEADISPTIGGDGASDEIIGFLIQGYEGDITKLWESNIFGKPLFELAREGISERLNALPVNARVKLQETLQRIVNEGRGTLICILL